MSAQLAACPKCVSAYRSAQARTSLVWFEACSHPKLIQGRAKRTGQTIMDPRVCIAGGLPQVCVGISQRPGTYFCGFRITPLKICTKAAKGMGRRSGQAFDQKQWTMTSVVLKPAPRAISLFMSLYNPACFDVARGQLSKIAPCQLSCQVSHTAVVHPAMLELNGDDFRRSDSRQPRSLLVACCTMQGSVLFAAINFHALESASRWVYSWQHVTMPRQEQFSDAHLEVQ